MGLGDYMEEERREDFINCAIPLMESDLRKYWPRSSSSASYRASDIRKNPFTTKERQRTKYLTCPRETFNQAWSSFQLTSESLKTPPQTDETSEWLFYSKLKTVNLWLIVKFLSTWLFTLKKENEKAIACRARRTGQYSRELSRNASPVLLKKTVHMN